MLFTSTPTFKQFSYVSDLVKLYNSPAMNPELGPRQLQAKVMFDIRFYFARRGSENFKSMTTKTFQVVHDNKRNLVYVMKDIDKLQKNHQEVDGQIITGYMPEIPGDTLCPVESFREYLSHLNPECDALWQSPINKPKTWVWYASSPVGDHTISDFMKNMIEKAQLSKTYTNHDIRVTGCTILGRCNFSDKQIMSISGDKSVESLKIYKRVSGDEKLMMGYTLGFALKNPKAIPQKEITGKENLLQICPKSDGNENKDGPQNKKQKTDMSKALLPVPVNAHNPTSFATTPHTPVQEIKTTTPEDNTVAIPDEYDFDLMALVADVQQNDMEIPPNPQEKQVETYKSATMSHTSTNTQINLNRNAEMPTFAHCHIGTINFNIIKK